MVPLLNQQLTCYVNDSPRTILNARLERIAAVIQFFEVSTPSMGLPVTDLPSTILNSFNWNFIGTR